MENRLFYAPEIHLEKKLYFSLGSNFWGDSILLCPPNYLPLNSVSQLQECHRIPPRLA
jgi:hypothetical protein